MRPHECITRRGFLRRTMLAAGAATFPLVLPGRVLGKDSGIAPSNRLTMGCIGVGRQGSGNMREFLGMPGVQVVAVCDVDAKRCGHARDTVDRAYDSTGGCATYGDFRELVARDDIDTVLVCTPDHWHVLPAIAAAKSGKDIYLEKPLSYSIAEGRALSDAVRRYGRIFQVGSQQRSEWGFRFGCELVRNGRIGTLQTIEVGLEGDPGNGLCPPMPVPPTFDYDFWLGPAPWTPYTEERCHPQNSYERPGWLRMTDYSGGMMTGWGAHHLDIAQWGLGTEYSGPVAVEGRGVFPRDGLWDVHGDFELAYSYANGVVLKCSSKYRGGVRFIGSSGKIFVSRGILETSPASLAKETLGADDTRLYVSNSHKGNFIECVKTRRETVAPVEVGHRSCTVCLLGNIAMLLGRRLRWDPEREVFPDDEEANRLLARPMRAPWHF